MATVKSFFGGYADKLQVMVDNSLDKFAPLWYPKFFAMGPTQQTLTYVTAIGRSRIEAAASIISRDSASPIRSRAALEKLAGEIPAISEKIPMKEEDYRNLLLMQSLNIDDKQKKDQILKFLFDDLKRAGDSAHKRIDYLCLEAVSTGKITITIDNNPDGIVAPVAVDLGLAADHKVNAAVNWATSATATPITDIEGIVLTATNAGKPIAKILMTPIAFGLFKKTKQVIDNLAGFFNINKGNVSVTMTKINEYLSESLLPVIELVDESIGIEKNGIVAPQRPFIDANVSFVPAGNLGEIKNAFAIEQIQPNPVIRYATYNKALLSKWQNNEPFIEFTKVEFNAFPSLDAIDAMYLLSTDASFV